MSSYKGTPRSSKETLEEILQDGCTEFSVPDRGIEASTLKHFGIRLMQDPCNPLYRTYYFPVTSRGEIRGFIKLDPQKSKKHGRFTTVGDVSVESDLLGQAQSTPGAYKVFIVEGFWDVLSSFQVLQALKPKNFKGIPSVVSPALGIGDINKGSTNARKQIGYNIEFLNTFKEKIVCFDNDPGEVNVGQMGVQDCSLVLKDFKNLILEKNDCNEVLRLEGPERLYKALCFEAIPYQPEHIISSSLGLEELLSPIQPGVRIDCLPKLMECWHGVRGEELTLILAPTGIGKTVICKEIGYDLVKKGYHVGHVFLEEKAKKTQQSYLAMDNNTWLFKFREDPSIIPLDKIKKSEEELLNNGRVKWISHFGSLTSKSLMDKFWWMQNAGCTDIILDHLSMVFSGQESRNERKDIDLLLTELAAFTVATGTRCWVVAHIKRIDKKEYMKDQYGMKFLKVTQEQARGSGSFEQLSMNIMTLEPEILEDGTRGCFRVRSGKSRELGWLGVADYLHLNKRTGRIQTYEPHGGEY